MGKNKVEYKDLEFLTNRSKELLDKQIQAYRQHHTNSGIVITILSVSIPLFIDKLSNVNFYFKFFSVLPLTLIIISIVKLVLVLTSKELYQGSNFKLIEKQLNDDYEDLLLKEIGSNKDSFHDNEISLIKIMKDYNLALKLTVTALVLMVIVLFINQFF